MQQPVIHFVVDPLCAWTYAAGPLMEKAKKLPEVAVEVHGGGMLAGESRRQISPEWKHFVSVHDQRIGQLSGQPFGDRYRNGLLNDESVTLDSLPSTVAMLVAQQVSGQGVQMLNLMQSAYFNQGKNITQESVLMVLADELGIEKDVFLTQYKVCQGSIQRHFVTARQLLQDIGGAGFPSAAIEVDGEYYKLAVSRFYGKPEQWLAYLNAQLNEFNNSFGDRKNENCKTV